MRQHRILAPNLFWPSFGREEWSWVLGEDRTLSLPISNSKRTSDQWPTTGYCSELSDRRLLINIGPKARSSQWRKLIDRDQLPILFTPKPFVVVVHLILTSTVDVQVFDKSKSYTKEKVISNIIQPTLFYIWYVHKTTKQKARLIQYKRETRGG